MGNINTRMSPLRKKALKKGFRSGLEMNFAEMLDKLKIRWEYETIKLDYTTESPSYRKMKCNKCGSNKFTVSKRYTPDFILTDLGLIIETKGQFTAKDRKKMLAVTKQNPNVDILIVFQYPHTRLTKQSKKTNTKWCNENRIKCVGIKESKAHFTELLDYLSGYKRTYTN